MRFSLEPQKSEERFQTISNMLLDNQNLNQSEFIKLDGRGLVTTNDNSKQNLSKFNAKINRTVNSSSEDLTSEPAQSITVGDENQNTIKDNFDNVINTCHRARKESVNGRSYADLITLAIESSASGQMRLSEIYDWFVENIPYFAERTDKKSSIGWKNSIRHNLSHYKKFTKVGTSKRTQKGSLWVVNTNAINDMLNDSSSNDNKNMLDLPTSFVRQFKADKIINQCESLKQLETTYNACSGKVDTEYIGFHKQCHEESKIKSHVMPSTVTPLQSTYCLQHDIQHSCYISSQCAASSRICQSKFACTADQNGDDNLVFSRHPLRENLSKPLQKALTNGVMSVPICQNHLPSALVHLNLNKTAYISALIEKPSLSRNPKIKASSQLQQDDNSTQRSWWYADELKSAVKPCSVYPNLNRRDVCQTDSKEKTHRQLFGCNFQQTEASNCTCSNTAHVPSRVDAEEEIVDCSTGSCACLFDKVDAITFERQSNLGNDECSATLQVKRQGLIYEDNSKEPTEEQMDDHKDRIFLLVKLKNSDLRKCCLFKQKY